MPVTKFDPRFKWIGAAGECSPGVARSDFVRPIGGAGEGSETLGAGAPAPFAITSNATDYFFTHYHCGQEPPSAGYSGGAQIGPVTPPANSIITPLAQLPGVITSLAYTKEGADFGAAWMMGATADDFTTSNLPVLVTGAANLASAIEQLATTGAVPTALGFDGTAIKVYGYVRKNDPLTYESSVLLGTGAQLDSDAATLASGGYFITAFGLTDATGSYAIVGTRPTGTTGSRDVMGVTETGVADGHDTDAITALVAAGWVIVGGNPSGADVHWIVER